MNRQSEKLIEAVIEGQGRRIEAAGDALGLWREHILGQPRWVWPQGWEKRPELFGLSASEQGYLYVLARPWYPRCEQALKRCFLPDILGLGRPSRLDKRKSRLFENHLARQLQADPLIITPRRPGLSGKEAAEKAVTEAELAVLRKRAHQIFGRRTW